MTEVGRSEDEARIYEIELFSGSYLDLADPQSVAISLIDVASGLSKTCRFSGQCRGFYSVAEHAVLVTDRVKEQGGDVRTQIGALHHDDHEAFMCDFPRPIKRLFPEYSELAEKVQAVAAHALELDFDFDSVMVKDADNWALMQEAGELMKSKGHWYSGGIVWDGKSRVQNLVPDDALTLWLDRHFDLVSELTD